MSRLSLVTPVLVLSATACTWRAATYETSMEPLGVPSEAQWAAAESTAHAALEAIGRVDVAAALKLRLSGSPVAQQTIPVVGGRCYVVSIAWPTTADGMSFGMGPAAESVGRLGVSVTTEQRGVLAKTFCADGDGDLQLSVMSLRKQAEWGVVVGERVDVAVAISSFEEPTVACEKRHELEDTQLRAVHERDRRSDQARLYERCTYECPSSAGLESWGACKEELRRCERRNDVVRQHLRDEPVDPISPAPTCRPRDAEQKQA